MVEPARTRLTGWGRTSPTLATVVSPSTVEQVVAYVRTRPDRGVTARGLGRSYGDPAQNAGGIVLDLTGLNRIHAIDTEAATVTVGAGADLDTLMRALLPHGLWIPVLPGTRQVTVGGAIAADVHGKNHHVDGSFGAHVTSLDLLTADGEVRTLRPDHEDPRLFRSTIGGMGLTGVVVQATIALQRTQSAYFLVDTERAGHLDDLIDRLSTGDDDHPYSVAWFDSVARGRHLGRAVITRGRKATVADLDDRRASDPLRFEAPALGRVPDLLPSGLLNRVTARAFNEVWFRKAPAERRGEIQNITQFFHPLDVVRDWNRVYGSRGFCQYQFVVPSGAEDALRESVRLIADSGHVSCLNVLKRFGPGNRSPLSFPMAGWTLAVDLPVSPGLDRLFAALDQVVVAAAGRVYLAKDSRLPARLLEPMYPQLDEFRAVRAEVDPERLFTSDLARRLGL